MTPGIRSVLAVGLGGLGDFLARWPLWQSARGSFPGARISFLGSPRHARLLLAAGLADEGLDFDEARWALPSGGDRRFDAVLSALGARGREWARAVPLAPGGRLIEIEPFPPEGARMPAGAHIEAQLPASGLADPGPLRCVLPEGLREWAGGWLAERGMRAGEAVAIHPGSGSAAKNWPRERYGELARALAERGRRVLLFEGEAEEGGGDSDPLSGAVIARGLDLVPAAALLSACGRYAGNDSGISHLAALLGVPCTVIFGPTDPVVWAPRGPRVTLVRIHTPCAPCGREEMLRCRNRRCLTGIGVQSLLSVL